MDGPRTSRGESNNDQDLQQQLATARGHIDAILRMVDEGRSCADVLHQISAVQGALATLRRASIEHHIRECVAPELATGKAEDVVRSLLDAVLGGARPSRGSEAEE